MWSSLSVTASDLKDFTLRTLIVTTSGGECNPIRRTWNWWMLTGRWFSGHLPGNNILDILITGTKNCAPWHLVLRAPDGDNIVDKGGTVTMVTRAVCAWEDGIWPNKLRAHTSHHCRPGAATRETHPPANRKHRRNFGWPNWVTKRRLFSNLWSCFDNLGRLESYSADRTQLFIHL